MRVSLFVDPVAELMPIARELGAERIELYTEPYAAAAGTDRAPQILERYARAAHAARDVELGVMQDTT